MGQVLHGSATTTEAIRRAIQRSEESVRVLARRHGISPTTVQKWRKRQTTADARMGPQQVRSTTLTPEQEAIVVACRRHTLLPLDDCLYALQPSIPSLTRSSLHRCLARHGISRLPQAEGDSAGKKRFKAYPIGYFHLDIAEVRTEQGKLYLFVAIDRTCKFAFAPLHGLDHWSKRYAPGRGHLSACPRPGGALPDPYRVDRQRRAVHQYPAQS
jgi:transposase